jgi:hypothetical protein
MGMDKNGFVNIFHHFPIIYNNDASLLNCNNRNVLNKYRTSYVGPTYVKLDSNNRFIKGATVLGTFTLSYKTTPHGLHFFGDVKTLIVLEAPVALFPQPTFAEQSYNQMREGEREVLTKKKNHPGFGSSN